MNGNRTQASHSLIALKLNSVIRLQLQSYSTLVQKLFSVVKLYFLYVILM